MNWTNTASPEKPHRASDDKGFDAHMTRGRAGNWKIEGAGIATLVMMAVYFLAVSWRKWPDPIADSGLQWYAFWRLGFGEHLYHDIVWNYGPISAYFNGALFKIFGPGMMVLVGANIVIYAAIVSLAYLAFRRAWGRLGAFVACAIFISVFSFSRLNSIANYNYATPYAHESTHGMLLLLATIFVAVRWGRSPSVKFAFLLGLCGGIATVLKPEFMLAGGIVGIAACALRFLQRQAVSIREFSFIAAGLVLPTLLFTMWFACSETIGAAFVDASRAWWMVLVDRGQSTTGQQQFFSGLNQPWLLARVEFLSAICAALVAAVVWAAGWFVNRSWSVAVRSLTAVAAIALLWFLSPQGGWYNPDPKVMAGWFVIGFSFPGLLFVVCVFVAWRVWREIKSEGHAEERTVMALGLVLAASAMLARMTLHARIHHLGFYQAALAGMVISAFLAAEIPRWTGAGVWGRRVAIGTCLVVLALGCASIAGKSRAILADQTQPVGSGRDRFYATAWDIDPTGALVGLLADRMKTVPPQATVFVFPEGAMINYLSRHSSPAPAIRDEHEAMERLRKTPPDYVIFISRDLADFGVKHLGGVGEPGHAIVQWVGENYTAETSIGGNPFDPDPNAKRGAIIFHKKAAASAQNR